MINSKDRNSISKFNNHNSSNWVGYLLLNNIINSYTWIKAPNSIPYDHRLDGKYEIKFNEETLLNMTEPDSFDMIIINFPQHQVPYEYKHLYDLIFDLFRKEE